MYTRKRHGGFFPLTRYIQKSLHLTVINLLPSYIAFVRPVFTRLIQYSATRLFNLLSPPVRSIDALLHRLACVCFFLFVSLFVFFFVLLITHHPLRARVSPLEKLPALAVVLAMLKPPLEYGKLLHRHAKKNINKLKIGPRTAHTPSGGPKTGS